MKSHIDSYILLSQPYTGVFETLLPGALSHELAACLWSRVVFVVVDTPGMQASKALILRLRRPHGISNLEHSIFDKYEY